LEFCKNTTDRTAFYVLDVLPLELLARLRERQSYWGQATDTWTETNLMGVSKYFIFLGGKFLEGYHKMAILMIIWFVLYYGSYLALVNNGNLELKHLCNDS